MVRTTLKDFVASNGYTSLSDVRLNKNGYPFITFLAGSDAENIYFSKNASSKVELGTTIKSIAKDITVVLVTYSDDRDEQYKLSFGSDEYTNTDDLF